MPIQRLDEALPSFDQRLDRKYHKVKPRDVQPDTAVGVARFDVSPEGLANLFGFPVGSRIERIERHHDRDEFHVVVRAQGLPVIPEGGWIEPITPTYETRIVRAGEVAEFDIYHVELASW